MKKQILVAVDGSVFSFNALRYISYLFRDLDDVFVHLFCVVPTGVMSPDREWMDELELMTSMSAQTRGRFARAKRFMEEAVLQLGRRGIEAAQVSTSVRVARCGITADIMNEATKGLYDALLIGRRGLSKVEEVFMGSVSSGILEKSDDLPIWIVDGKVDSRKFLMPVDASFNSLKAADHLSFILKGNPYAEITLFHMTSFFGEEKKKTNRDELEKRWGKEWCDVHLDREDSVYYAPEQMLLKNGIAPGQIKRCQRLRGVSVTRHIVKHSIIDKYGTIVIGRREKSGRNTLFRGVSEKVLSMASGVAVWIVG